MEGVFRRSGLRGSAIEEEKRVDSVGDHKEEIVSKEAVVTSREGSSIGSDNSRAPSSSKKKEQDDELESTRAEMGEVREKNERLKMHLDRIMNDYKTLEMRFYEIFHQDANKSNNTSDDHHQEVEETELVALSLGRFSSDKKNKTSSSGKEEDDHHVKEGLSLGLQCKFQVSKSAANEALPHHSPANSFEDSKDEAGETWPPSKALKTIRSGYDDISQQNPVKRAKVSVRARCDAPTMNDGCQWRKYGQKIAKGNPCPRAYYRCTFAPSCPVRKQVQRCCEDMSILITTYEGTHNHPLPVSATAMASTTSAAVSMLLSASSRSAFTAPPTSITAPNNNILNGLNFFLTDTSKSKQFYLPNPSLSSTPSCPTITLDLTTPPSSSSPPFGRFNTYYPSTTPTYSTSLRFGSSESNFMPWGNNLHSYGSTQPYIKNQIGTRQPMENIYQSYIEKGNVPAALQQSIPADTIAAATKAITADPSFQSALVAALTSIIRGGKSSSASQASGSGDNLEVTQKLKWGEQFPV